VCELPFNRRLPDKQGAHCNRSGTLTQRQDVYQRSILYIPDGSQYQTTARSIAVQQPDPSI
jgi:hypothetical protein